MIFRQFESDRSKVKRQKKTNDRVKRVELHEIII